MSGGASGDVVIVGGGIVGLSIAYALAGRGIAATVLDRREPGREASWAGAGMIPPPGDRPATHPTVAIRTWSARLQAEWAARLREETGIDNGYRRTGGVDAAFTDAEALELKSCVGRWKVEGVAYERLHPGDFARVEPALSPRLQVAYYLPDRAQIRNPRHLRALHRAVLNRGSRVSAWTAAEGFDVDGGRIRAVRTGSGSIACGAAVVAAGAWSESLLRTLGLTAPTPPVKGEIALLRSDRPLLGRIVEYGRRYFVPRDDGRILIGATEERVGFDVRTTTRGVHDLLGAAIRVCPVLQEAEVETTWAGLRPGSLDGRPYLGPAPGFDNLFVATGHHRAGLQLSPASAEIVADLIEGKTPPVDVSAFRLDREPDPAPADSFRS